MLGMLRAGRRLVGPLPILCGALLALAAAPALGGSRGLRAAQRGHVGMASHAHVSHGVEVGGGCALDGVASRPGHLAPRPVADRPLRRAPQHRPHHDFHGQPVWIFVDDGPEIVIDHPGVVILIE